MTKKQAIQLFEKQKVRTIWDDEQEKWYFCVVDVVEVLTDSANPQTYWRVLKNRLKKEGNETVTNCNALKMRAADGKMRLTDVADSEQLFRLIQSIPSPKAEPFKLWMAQVASQRLDQMQDPELSIDQAIIDYKRLGYSDAWINQRIKIIEVRKELTDEWKHTGVKDGLLPIFPSSVIPKAITPRHKVAKEGGSVAKAARKQLESKLGRSVISKSKASDYLLPDKTEEGPE